MFNQLRASTYHHRNPTTTAAKSQACSPLNVGETVLWQDFLLTCPFVMLLASSGDAIELISWLELNALLSRSSHRLNPNCKMKEEMASREVHWFLRQSSCALAACDTKAGRTNCCVAVQVLSLTVDHLKTRAHDEQPIIKSRAAVLDVKTVFDANTIVVHVANPPSMGWLILRHRICTGCTSTSVSRNNSNRKGEVVSLNLHVKALLTDYYSITLLLQQRLRCRCNIVAS